MFHPAILWLSLLLQIAALVYIGIEVHWSVAIFLAWLSVSLYSINRVRGDQLALVREECDRKIKKTRNDMSKMVKKAANKVMQDTTVKVFRGPMPQGIIKKLQSQPGQLMRQVPPEVLAEDNRPMCSKCREEGLPDLYYEGNCPIHD